MSNLLKYILLSFLLLFITSKIYSKNLGNEGLVWINYTNNLKFNEKLTLSSEIHERFFITPVKQHQNVYRFKLHYKIGKTSNWEIAPGMVFFLQSTPQNPDRDFTLIVPEVRPQLDLNYSQKLKHVTFQHRYRFEARYFHNVSSDKKSLEDGYTFSNFRFRYQFAAVINIIKFKENQKFQLKIGDELHINLGKKVVDNYFDQNRIFGSFLLDVTPSLNLELGYLYWYQHSANNDRIHRHFLRVGVNQTIQLKGKKS
jgi:rRNA maturation protein Rpf1